MKRATHYSSLRIAAIFRQLRQIARVASVAMPYVGPEFIPSEAFLGQKPGYVFKLDSLGLGYYARIRS